MTGKGVSWVVAVPLLLMFLVGGAGFWIAMPEIYLGQIWVAVGVLLALYYGRTVWASKEATRIAREGIPGIGRVLSLKETGMQVDNRPLVKVRLKVEAPGIEPFEFTRRLVVPYSSMTSLSAGVVPVVLDRQDHSKVIIDFAGVSGPRRKQSQILDSI